MSAYLSLFMSCWNFQENLDSDLFWAGEGGFCGDFPPFGFLAPRNRLANTFWYPKTAFFEAHLLCSLKIWQLCSPKSYTIFMEPSYTIVKP